MDGIEENSSVPNVQIAERNFLTTRMGKITLGIVVFLIIAFILAGILNYFNLISPPFLHFLPKLFSVSNKSTPVDLAILPQTYSIKAADLILKCPVDKADCKSADLVKAKETTLVSYDAAIQSLVSNLIKVPSLENIAVLFNREAGKKYFYESTISKDAKSCYTIAYTLPEDASFGDLLSFPRVTENMSVATLGSKKIKINGQEANVVIQVRNSPIDPGVPCSLLRKSPKFFDFFEK